MVITVYLTKYILAKTILEASILPHILFYSLRKGSQMDSQYSPIFLKFMGYKPLTRCGKEVMHSVCDNAIVNFAVEKLILALISSPTKMRLTHTWLASSRRLCCTRDSECQVD